VIGGNRFVGYLLVWRLLAAGHQVTTLNRGTLPDPFGDRIERLRGDRVELERHLGARAFDAVVDFAAFVERDAQQLVELLRSGRAGHAVFVSSGQVYLVKQRCPWPAREDDYAGPLLERPDDEADRAEWEYGIGKRACEDALAASGGAFTSIRIPIVNGERDHRRRLERYLWRLLDGGPVILPDDGENPTRHVYGADVARAIAGLLGNRVAFGRAFNLAQDETVSLRELVERLREQLGSAAPIVGIPRDRLVAAGLDVNKLSPFSGRWASRLDPSRAKAELNFRHERLDAYLGKIVASFLAAPPLSPPEGYEKRAVEREVARA
jgi:nucleoside-diphosphate-sugar epimerase